MGQPKVASATWRDRIRHISQGFYETMGQQIPQTRASEPMRAWSHVKILNRDLRSTVIFLRKPKGISQTFRLRGRHCKWFKPALNNVTKTAIAAEQGRKYAADELTSLSSNMTSDQ